LDLLALLTAAGVATSFVSAQSTQSVPSTPERVAEMRHHFTEVTQIHEAVIRGDLPAVREPATKLGDIAIPSGVPDSAVQYVAAIRTAGRRAATATTLVSAAQATVSMVTECANCHRAVGVLPAPTTPPGPDVGGLVGHMLVHKRAADEMLQGLVIPSASRWREGAERLRTAALRPSQLPSDPKLTREIRQADEKVHKLADQAVKADTASARASTYVELLTTCAECHGLRKMWGPRTER
jgi:cytochrome c553